MDQVNLAVDSPSGSNDIESLQNGYPHIKSKAEYMNPQRLILKARKGDSADISPFSTSQSTFHSRRRAPETAHSRAVNQNRKMHVEHILHQQLATHQRSVRKSRRADRSTFGMMVLNRLKELPDMYDTEDEKSLGPGGLSSSTPKEEDDYGEEALRYRKIINRAIRRLSRGQQGGPVANIVKSYVKQSTSFNEPVNGAMSKTKTSRKATVPRSSGRTVRTRRKQEEQLDDLDLDLLGENRDEAHDDDSAIDESEVDDAEMTEEEMPNPM